MPRTIHARLVGIAVLALAAATTAVTTLAVPSSQAAESTLSSTARIEIGGYSDASFAHGLTINDEKASRYPSETGPTGLAGTVTDVDVRIAGFSHERPRDVDILLEAPNGQTVVLMSDVGGTTPVAGLDLTFDDQALAEVNPAGVPQTGTWRPSNEDSDDVFPAPAPVTTPAASLSALNGQRPGGNWALYVFDDTFDYFGSVTNFWIDIETSGPNPYPSTITVPASPSFVTDVDVTLTGLRHPYAPDVDVLIVGPHGQQATIFSDANALASGPVDLTFDDSASAEVPLSMVSGTYLPVNDFGADEFPAPAPTATGASSLAIFNGTNPSGDWKLYVVDDHEFDAGTLDGWSLRFTTQDPPTQPPTATPAPTPAPTATPAPDVDTTHPRVSSRRPAARATGVRRDVSVVAGLDERARLGTVTPANAYLVRAGSTRRVRAAVTWNPVTFKLVIDPRLPLRARTTYRVVVTTRIADLAGNRLDQDPATVGLQRSTWRFATR